MTPIKMLLDPQNQDQKHVDSDKMTSNAYIPLLWERYNLLVLSRAALDHQEKKSPLQNNDHMIIV
jgi:hypothetical protein